MSVPSKSKPPNASQPRGPFVSLQHGQQQNFANQFISQQPGYTNASTQPGQPRLGIGEHPGAQQQQIDVNSKQGQPPLISQTPLSTTQQPHVIGQGVRPNAHVIFGQPLPQQGLTRPQYFRTPMTVGPRAVTGMTSMPIPITQPASGAGVAGSNGHGGRHSQPGSQPGSLPPPTPPQQGQQQPQQSLNQQQSVSYSQSSMMQSQMAQLQGNPMGANGQPQGMPAQQTYQAYPQVPGMYAQPMYNQPQLVPYAYPAYRASPYAQQSYQMPQTAQQHTTQFIFYQGTPQPPPVQPGVQYFQTALSSQTTRPGLPMTIAGTNIQVTQQTPPQPVSSAPRERKRLQILDPKTGRDVIEDMVTDNERRGGSVSSSSTRPASTSSTPPASGISSARDSPPADTPPSEIAAQFALQVATAAASKPDLTNVGLTQQQDANIEQSPGAELESIEQSLDKSHSTIKVAPVIASPEHVAFAPPVPALISVSVKPLVSEPAEDKKVVEMNVFAPVSAEPSARSAAVVVQTKVAETENVGARADVQPKENGELLAPMTDAREVEVKHDNKKKRPKAKDINKRADSREVGELDAYIDKSEVASAAPLAATAHPQPSAEPKTMVQPKAAQVIHQHHPSPPVAVVAPTVVPQSVQLIDTQNEDNANSVQQKVLEKNRENAAKSVEIIPTSAAAVAEFEARPLAVQRIETSPAVLDPPAEKGETLNNNNIVESVEKKAPVTPCVEYKDGCWSPANPDGKKQYDREFLLNISKTSVAQKKPEGLPDIEIVKTLGSKFAQSMSMHNIIKPDFDFTPNFMSIGKSASSRQSRGGGGGQQGGHGSQQGRKESQRQIKINLSINQDVKLHETENAWKAPSKVKGPQQQQQVSDDENASTEDLYKKFRGILNKLTPQKFDDLVQQVFKLTISTQDRLKGVINLVFEKAIDEPSFSVEYAKLCHKLSTIKVPLCDSEEHNPSKPPEFVNFRKLLLIQCQEEFEKNKDEEMDLEERQRKINNAETEDQRKLMKLELDEAEMKARRRSNGNIRFIGELFKLNILVDKIMLDCLSKLLTKWNEDSLECLCGLLKTIGQRLEYPPMQPFPARADDTQQFIESKMKERQQSVQATNQAFMKDYVVQMKKIVDDRQTSSRIRFMLQDVIELRENRWTPRRVENKPRTLDEIHKEAKADEDKQIQLLAQQQALKYAEHLEQKEAGSQRKSIKNRTNQYTDQRQDDGWQTKGKSRPLVAPSTAPAAPVRVPAIPKFGTDSIQLGPGGMGNRASWMGGASGGGFSTNKAPEGVGPQTGATGFGTGRDSSRGERQYEGGNRFNALSSGGDRDQDGVRGSRGSTGRDSRGGRSNTNIPPRMQQQQQNQQRHSLGGVVGGGGASSTSSPPPQASSGPGINPRLAPATMQHPRTASPLANTRYGTPAQQPAFQKLEDSSKFSELTTLRGDPKRGESDIKMEAGKIADDYMVTEDIAEATRLVAEACVHSTTGWLVNEFIYRVLEKKEIDRKQIGSLLGELIRLKLVSPDVFSQQIASVLVEIDDLIIDIPRMWHNLAEIVMPVITSGVLSLASLSLCFQSKDPEVNYKTAMLFAHILLAISKCSGQMVACQNWQRSNLRWSDYLGTTNEAHFIETNKLGFLMNPTAAGHQGKQCLTQEEIRNHLVAFCNRKDSVEQVMDWVGLNVMEEQLNESLFIRALTTAVCDSLIKEVGEGLSFQKDEFINRRLGLLFIKYIAGNEQRELQAIYAMQGIAHKLNYPKGLLKIMFETLHGAEVISDEAFFQWEKTADPAFASGWGVAVPSVHTFLVWLRESTAVDSNDES